jgi:hypothetical protein
MTRRTVLGPPCVPFSRVIEGVVLFVGVFVCPVTTRAWAAARAAYIILVSYLLRIMIERLIPAPPSSHWSETGQFLAPCA